MKFWDKFDIIRQRNVKLQLFLVTVSGGISQVPRAKV